MATKLTIEEIKKISLGYNWEPNMSQSEFIKKNELSYEEGVNLYKQIDDRYIQYVYEEENK